MAKITALPVADDILGAEHLPIVQDGITKRVTMAAFRQIITPYLQYWYKGERGDVGPEYTPPGTLLADCTGIGAGTDMAPDIADFIHSRVDAIGSGALIMLSEGRRRVATPQVIDLQGCNNITIDLGTITPDSVAMTAFTFTNGYNISIRARLLEGGCFAGYGAPLAYFCDYTLNADVVSIGGQEAIKIAGIFGYTLDVAALNYAGRAVRITQRMNTQHPDTGACKGRIQTSRGDDLSKPRVAQSLYADPGTNIGQGNWGELDACINDFDWYPPVWVDLNDIRVKTFDCAFAINGPQFLGCEAIELGSVYVGDIDNNPQNNHIKFGASPSGRLCRFVSYGTMRFLNQGNGARAVSVTDFHGGVINHIANAEFSSAVVLVNCNKVDISVAAEHGSNIGYVQGAASDDIRVRVIGKNFSSNAFFVRGGVTGKINIDGTLAEVPDGYSLIYVDPDSPAALIRLNVDLTSAHGTLINVPATNNIYYNGGSVKGNVWGSAGRPRYVNRDAIFGVVPV